MSNDILLVGQIYISNEENKRVYQENVLNLANFGYPILIVDSSPTEYVFDHSGCDYYLYDKNNLLFDRKPLNMVNWHFTTVGPSNNINLSIPCYNSSPHELNILYQNTKAFSLAKTLEYKYVIRVECDIHFNENDIKNIKEKINQCIEENKNSAFLYNGVSFGFHVSFYNIDHYFEKIGKILNQKDWENLLEKYNFSDDGLENIFPKIFTDYINFDPLIVMAVLAYRYKETKRFLDSNVILDFFKDDSNDRIYLACTNNYLDKFPDKITLTQYIKERTLIDGVSNSVSVTWIFIDQNVDYVELNIDDKIHKFTKEDLVKTQNTINFIP
jgi:hypothetical protein